MAHPVNEQLRDLVLRRAVRQGRMENACVREVLGVWRGTSGAVRTRVRAALVGVKAHPTSGFGLLTSGRFRLAQEVLLDVGSAILAAQAQMAACLERDLPQLAELELRELPRQVETVLDRALAASVEEGRRLWEQTGPALGLSFQLVPTLQIAELLAGPLGGAFFQQAFADLSARALRKLRSILLSGLVSGLSVATLARQVEQALKNTRAEAERIVRSEYVRVANQAALFTYDQNKEILKGVQWVATLDSLTCLFCAKLDGKVWADPADAKVPVVNSHPRCRCSLLPVVKDSEALGLPPSTRDSFTGQVSATLTYTDWFAQQDAEFQRDVLGPTRYNLYQSGQVALGDFAGVTGERRVADVLALVKRG